MTLTFYVSANHRFDQICHLYHIHISKNGCLITCTGDDFNVRRGWDELRNSRARQQPNHSVQDRVLNFCNLETLDIFNKTSGQFKMIFVAKVGQNVMFTQPKPEHRHSNDSPMAANADAVAGISFKVC